MQDLKRRKTVPKIINYDSGSIPTLIKTIENTITQDGSDDILFIVDDSKFQMDAIWKKVPAKYHRIIFSKKESTYSILDNTMVPKHSKVHTNVQGSDQLPVILSYDPVVRRMNFRLGDVIKIDNNGKDYYRIVK